MPPNRDLPPSKHVGQIFGVGLIVCGGVLCWRFFNAAAGSSALFMGGLLIVFGLVFLLGASLL